MMLLFVGTLLFLNNIGEISSLPGFARRFVIANAGLCKSGCNIRQRDLYYNETFLKLGLADVATSLRHDYKSPYFDYFMYSSYYYKFSYCQTEEEKLVRCSDEGKTSAIFVQHKEYRKFDGYLVKDWLPCADECKLVPIEKKFELRCEVTPWDLISGEHGCSYYADIDKFAIKFYQLSIHGLLVGKPSVNQPFCITLAKNDVGWYGTNCSQEGSLDVTGQYACESECEFRNKELTCLLANGEKAACNINLPIGKTATRCFNWLQRSMPFTSPPPKEPSTGKEMLREYQCIDGNILLQVDSIKLSSIGNITHNFTCADGSEAKVVTILSVGSIIIDENVAIQSRLDRKFKQMILVARKIEIPHPVQINLRGADSYEGVGDWASGGNGGSFYAAALQWEGTELLQVDSSGGDSGCKLVPIYSTKYTRIIEDYLHHRIVFKASNFTFEYLRDNSTNCRTVCHEFKMFGPLKYTIATVGVPGEIMIYGTHRNASTKSEAGQQRACDRIVPQDQNCVNTMYTGKGEWFARVFDLKIEKYEIPERYYYPIREWAVKLHLVWNETDVIQMYEMVNSLQSKLNLDTSTMFYQELRILILKSFEMYDSLELVLLKSLENRLIDHSTLPTNRDTLLDWVYMAATQHLERVNGQNKIIINLRTYINDQERKIKTLSNEIHRAKLLQNISNTVIKEADLEIKEVERDMRLKILPKVKIIRKDLAGLFENVKLEIQEFIKDGKKHADELRSNFEASMTKRNAELLLNTINLGGAGIAQFGGNAKIAGEGVQSATDAFKEYNSYIHKPQNNTKQIPNLPDIWKNARHWSDWIDEKQSLLQDTVDILIEVYSGNSKLEDFINFLSDQQFRLLNFKDKNNKRKQYELVKDVELTIFERTEDIERNIGETRSTRAASFAPNPSAVFNAIKVLGTDYIKSTEDIIKFEKAMLEAEANVREWGGFETGFENSIAPMALGILDTFDLATKEIKQEFVGRIVINSWEIQTSVKELFSKISKGLEVFKAKYDIINRLEEVTSLFETVTKVFNSIADRNRKKKEAMMIGNYSNAANSDVEIAEFKANLDKTMIESIIYTEVENTISAFSQWSFPFAGAYFPEFVSKLPFNFANNDSNGTKAVEISSKRLTHMKRVLDQDGYTLRDVRQFLLNGPFRGNDSDASNPFFIWKYNVNQESILKLLSTKPVCVFADIKRQEANLEKDAIKFHTIGFRFKAVQNNEKQELLDRELKRCYLNATHMGIGRYQFRNKTYMFSSEPQTFISAVGEEKDATEYYESGIPLLSPFSTWCLQLLPFDENFDLDGVLPGELEEINLELIGSGQYIPKILSPNYNGPLDGFYKMYEVAD